MSVAQHCVIFVRSIDRTYGSSSSFTVQLPQTFNNILGIQLLDAAIPVPFNLYGIYTWGVSFTVAASTQAFTLSVGNYAVTDLIAALKTWLQSTFATLGTVTITYSTVSGCLSFAWSGAAVSLTAQSTSNNGLGYVVGLSTSLTSYVLTNGGALPYVVNLAPVGTFLLQMTNLTNNIATTAQFNAMFRIQTSTPAGSVCYTNNATNVANNVPFSSAVQGITKFDCLLLDQNSQQVQLGGQEWTFSVGVTWSQ